MFHTIFLLLFNKVHGSLTINKIITRLPKPKDIGLIFDVTLVNTDEDELLSFRIRADDYCCVNVAPDIAMGKMGRIVGGDFGFIEPGAIKKVSLIWPAVSLYNRVGLCPIAVTSTNVENKVRTSKQMIKFDTRFQILDPDNYTLRKQKDYFDCENWDTDRFKNCTPVDCEKRYFGLSNFYNSTSEKCEEMPQCSEKYQIYDVFLNKCTDTRVILTEEDLEGFKESKFDNNNAWELKSNFKNDQLNQPKDQANDEFPEDVSHLYPFAEKSLKENKRSAWLHGLCEGLLIVFATIVIYILICFSIFLLVTWLSRQSNLKGQARPRGIDLTHSSHENIPIYTTSSLMSQR